MSYVNKPHVGDLEVGHMTYFGGQMSAVGVTSDSQSVTPDELRDCRKGDKFNKVAMGADDLRKEVDQLLSGDPFDDLLRVRSAARAAADAWEKLQYDADIMAQLLEADREQLREYEARIEALKHDLVLMRTDRDAAEYHVEALEILLRRIRFNLGFGSGWLDQIDAALAGKG